MGDFRRRNKDRKDRFVGDIILTILFLGSCKILLEILDVINR